MVAAASLPASSPSVKTRVRACCGGFINRDNAQIKRRHRAIGERIDDEDPQGVTRVSRGLQPARIHNKGACPFVQASNRVNHAG